MSEDILWTIHESLDKSRIVGLQEAIYYCYCSGVAGDIAEFGTMSGYTAYSMALAMLAAEKYHGRRPKKLWLFDSFVGLPPVFTHPADENCLHAKRREWLPEGCQGLNQDELDNAISMAMQPAQYNIVGGWYADTVPLLDPAVRFGCIHVDCDLYQSTMDALDPLFASRQIADGAVICFDDWTCNRFDPNFGEQRAFCDLTEKYYIHASFWGFYSWGGARFVIHGYGDRQ